LLVVDWGGGLQTVWRTNKIIILKTVFLKNRNHILLISSPKRAMCLLIYLSYTGFEKNMIFPTKKDKKYVDERNDPHF